MFQSETLNCTDVKHYFKEKNITSAVCFIWSGSYEQRYEYCQ